MQSSPWNTEDNTSIKNSWNTEQSKMLSAPCKYIGAYGKYKYNISVQIHRCRRWDCRKGCGMAHKQELVNHFTKLLEGRTLYTREFEFDEDYWKDMQIQISHSKQGFLLVKTVTWNEDEPWWTGKAVLIMDHMLVAIDKPKEGIKELLERIIPDRTPSETEKSRPVTYSRKWAPPKEEKEVSEDRVVVRYLPQKFAFWVAEELDIRIAGKYIKVDSEDNGDWIKWRDTIVYYYKEIYRRIKKRCGNSLAQMTDERQEREVVKESNLVMKETVNKEAPSVSEIAEAVKKEVELKEAKAGK